MLKTFIYKLKTKSAKLFTGPNREILAELTRANLKKADYDSWLGILWSLTGSVASLLLFYIIFKANFGKDIKDYPVYLLSGMICVNFFSTVTIRMINTFFGYREFVLNSTVPREIILVSNLTVCVFKLAIDLLLCLILSAFYGTATLFSILLILPLMIVFVAFVFAISMFLSLIYCFAGDIEHIWSMGIRIVYFVTPVFYNIGHLHPITRKLIYLCNPLTPFVISIQNLFLGKIDMPIYIYSILTGIFLFICGYSIFIAIENSAMERA